MPAVRIATPDDAAEVWPLVLAFATSYRPVHEVFVGSFADVLADPDALTLVATEDGSVVGYLLAHRLSTFFANAPVLWVEELMVEEAHRRSGAGSALMAAAETAAERNGCAYVSLASRRAGDFYRAIGYDESATFFKKALSADGEH